MNGVDITARGLARQALNAEAETGEGAINMDARSEPTAAALEALSAGHAALMGVAGATHAVETAPYLTRNPLIIKGNGAELRNVNSTPLSTSDQPQAVLPVGTSNPSGTDTLTYYAVESASGTVVTVAAGDGDNFAEGDLVVARGATNFVVSGTGCHVYRNYTRARVLAATAATITLDRTLPAELIADSPVIANTGHGASAGIAGLPEYYLLYAPHISNLTLASDLGETLKWGGVIDGTFRDLTMIGRDSVVLNAMQDSLIENVRFHSWRKICELAEGSVGTTVRNVRGTLSDASARFGGASDAGSFWISIGENSANCTLEDLQVDSGVNTPTGTSAALLGSGRANIIRQSKFRFPALTGYCLTIESSESAGNPVLDCGFEDIEIWAPLCDRFIHVGDGGAGIDRPFFRNLNCHGAVSSGYAATLVGCDGIMENCRFDAGSLHFTTAVTGWTICNNYIPGGFDNPNENGGSLFETNRIYDNDSEANRRANAAAVISTDVTPAITATAANTVFKSATFEAGDLEPGDRIIVYAPMAAGGEGSNNRTAGVSVSTPTAGRQGCGSNSITAPGSLTVECEMLIHNNTQIVVRPVVGGAENTPAIVTVDDISVTGNDLTVNIEGWVATSSELINVRGCRIVPVKRGMRHLPLR